MKLILLTLTFLNMSCGLVATRPKLEMSLAAAAFLAAKNADAAAQVPNLYRNAELYYLKAKSAYRRKYFNKAEQFAKKSRDFSEKAEFAAKRKKTLENL